MRTIPMHAVGVAVMVLPWAYGSRFWAASRCGWTASGPTASGSTSATRQLCVLVVLLLEANLIVSADRLVERVWGDHALAATRTTLYGYLHRLRKLQDGCGAAILRRQGGYVLAVDPSVVDAHLFVDLVERARAEPGRREGLALFDLWGANSRPRV